MVYTVHDHGSLLHNRAAGSEWINASSATPASVLFVAIACDEIVLS